MIGYITADRVQGSGFRKNCHCEPGRGAAISKKDCFVANAPCNDTFIAIRYTLYAKKGVSLIELMIVLVIFVLIGECIAYILSSGEGAWYMSDARLVATQENRRAMSAAIRELRQTAPAEIANCPADGLWRIAQLNFSVPVDLDNDGDVLDALDNIEWGAVTYQTTAQAQLERQSGGANSVLCNNIMRIYFRRQAATPDVLEVALWTLKWTRYRSGWGWMASQVFTCNIKMRN